MQNFNTANISYNNYVTKLGWGNVISGCNKFCVIGIAVTAAKTIPGGTIIGTLPFNVTEISVPLIQNSKVYIIAYGNNIRIENQVESGQSILAKIPTFVTI